ARRAARFLILQPPMPVVARGPYLALAAAAASMLPWWARWPLRLPWLPLTEATAITALGDAVTRTIRWATTPAEVVTPTNATPTTATPDESRSPTGG
ncbi:MAG: hypothetical protein M3Q72_12525, partial [Actinomycetota bacterium]|nr:hypothetical protein [Actinomycetota bacterium]